MMSVNQATCARTGGWGQCYGRAPLQPSKKHPSNTAQDGLGSLVASCLLPIYVLAATKTHDGVAGVYSLYHDFLSSQSQRNSQHSFSGGAV